MSGPWASHRAVVMAALALSIVAVGALALLLVYAPRGGIASTPSGPIFLPTEAGSPSPAAFVTVTAGSPSPVPTVTATPGLPTFRHVYVIIMENQGYSDIVGSRSAPYLNQLIARYGLATNFYAEAHPSEPNYIALTSGGLQGTDSDGRYDLSVPSVFDQIEASGRSWHVYAQGYPDNCYKGTIAASVADGTGAAGEYVRKHNPAISYISISGNPTRCANITRLAGFDPAAADLEMIIPNQVNDMHSSSVAAGDAFLKAFVPLIEGNAAFEGSVLFITWDEAQGSDVRGGGGHIATIVVSPNIPPGSRFEGAATHYSMLRTIELAWGMPLLGAAATASTIEFDY
jgi:hypothetical protein